MSVPRFWREIPQRYALRASRCGTCLATYFPPRQVCPTCRRASIGKMVDVKLSGRGTILESTRVHKPAPGYEMQVPYVLALVQTPEGPRVMGQVVDSDAETIEVGAQVQAVFRRIGQDGEAGVIYYGTKWKVVRDVATADEASEAKSKGKETKPKRKPLLGRGKKE